MRSAIVIFLGAFAVGVLVLVTAGLTERRAQAFTLGVIGSQPVAALEPGVEACQAPIDVSADFQAVRLVLGTFRRPGPSVEAGVRDATNGLAVGRSAHLAGGYGDNEAHRLSTGTVRAGRRIEVCVRNRGRVRVALYGSRTKPPSSAPRGAKTRVGPQSSAAYLDGRRLDADIDLVFERAEPKTLLSLAPEMVGRSVLFRGSWSSPLTGWLLFALLLVGLPLVGARAVGLATGARPREKAGAAADRDFGR
jgi:hypothetical protein